MSALERNRRRRQNHLKSNNISNAPHVSRFCSHHILTSSVFSYRTDTGQNGTFCSLFFKLFQQSPATTIQATDKAHLLQHRLWEHWSETCSFRWQNCFWDPADKDPEKS